MTHAVDQTSGDLTNEEHRDLLMAVARHLEALDPVAVWTTPELVDALAVVERLRRLSINEDLEGEAAFEVNLLTIAMLNKLEHLLLAELSIRRSELIADDIKGPRAGLLANLIRQFGAAMAPGETTTS